MVELFHIFLTQIIKLFQIIVTKNRIREKIQNLKYFGYNNNRKVSSYL